jgi:hypothetical protein
MMSPPDERLAGPRLWQLEVVLEGHGGNRAEIIGSIRNTGYGRFRCIRFARARAPGPRAVAASDGATVVTCAARRGALSSSTSPDSENPPSVLGSVKFFQILAA